MTIEQAKAFARLVVSGNATLKRAGLVEVMETLLAEIDRLEKRSEPRGDDDIRD